MGNENNTGNRIIDKPDTASDFFRADIPLENPSLDRFGRYTFSQRIAQAIAERKNPSSIIMGLNGSFGGGKTTVLNFIQRELSNYREITVIRFNPWRYQNENQIIKAFFSSLSRAFQFSENKISDNVINQLFENYTDLLTSGSKSSPSMNLSRQNRNNDIESVRNNIEREFILRKKQIVFLIDDLDKLEKYQIKNVLKLIKLNASFSFVIYVIAYDENVIIKALGESNENARLNTGKRLLGKIVQISINLPQISKAALQKFSVECINDLLRESEIKLEENQSKIFWRLLKNCLALRIKSVRDIKQYSNILSFSLPAVRHDVDLVDFLLIEGIKTFYPTVYEAVKNHPYYFQCTNNGSSETSQKMESLITDILEKSLEPFVPDEKNAALYILSYLFPAIYRLQSVLGSLNGIEKEIPKSESEKNNHIFSKQYFRRYFSYFASDKDPLEEELDNFLSLLEYEDPGIIKAKIDELSRNAGPESFLAALRSKIPGLSAETCIKLIDSLSGSGDHFSNPDTLFSFLTAYTHPASLIRELLIKINDASICLKIAKDLLTEATPFSFAFECYRWMCTVENNSEDERLFSDSAEEELGEIIAGRISEFAEREPLYISAPKETPFLLSAWSYLSGKESTGYYLARSFTESKNNIVSFLQCYLPDNSGLQSDIIWGLDQFSSISNVIDPKEVFTSLLDNLGEDFLVDNEGESGISEMIARNFAKTYKSFNFLNSPSPEPEGVNYLKKVSADDNRRKVTIVKKGIYKPIIQGDK